GVPRGAGLSLADSSGTKRSDGSRQNRSDLSRSSWSFGLGVHHPEAHTRALRDKAWTVHTSTETGPTKRCQPRWQGIVGIRSRDLPTSQHRSSGTIGRLVGGVTVTTATFPLPLATAVRGEGRGGELGTETPGQPMDMGYPGRPCSPSRMKSM